jgi:atypical dual specificity phosphatase
VAPVWSTLRGYAGSWRTTWLDEASVAACRYPRGEGALRALADGGVTLLVNLHERAHPPEALARHGLSELHLSVADFTAPTQAQLRRGVEAIAAGIADGRRVAAHCGAGLGRTGTLLACYFVYRGLSPTDAIARVRAARPGSVETAAQAAAVAEYARGLAEPDSDMGDHPDARGG